MSPWKRPLGSSHGDAESSEDFVRAAQDLINQGEGAKAERVLKEGLSRMPPDWKPKVSGADHIAFAFWDVQEFLAYIHCHKTTGEERKVLWMLPSYSKAWHLLAFIAVERREWARALEAIDQALDLEPDHPAAICEKAMILARMNRHQEAYQLYMKAQDIRPWTPSSVKARALRGAGATLIDLGRLDEAQTMLEKSLALEPDNDLARAELAYIDHLRRGGRPTGRRSLSGRDNETAEGM